MGTYFCNRTVGAYVVGHMYVIDDPVPVLVSNAMRRGFLTPYEVEVPNIQPGRTVRQRRKPKVEEPDDGEVGV